MKFTKYEIYWPCPIMANIWQQFQVALIVNFSWVTSKIWGSFVSELLRASWHSEGGGQRGVKGGKKNFWLKMLKIAQFIEKSGLNEVKKFSVYLLNKHLAILNRILKIFDLQIWDVQGFYCPKTFEIPHIMRKSSSEKSKLPRKIQNLPICIWGYDGGTQVSNERFSKSRCFLETLD